MPACVEPVSKLNQDCFYCSGVGEDGSGGSKVEGRYNSKEKLKGVAISAIFKHCC